MRLASGITALLLSFLLVGCPAEDPGDQRPPTWQECRHVGHEASCEEGIASTSVYWGGGTTSATLCRREPEHAQVSCAAGCAVEGMTAESSLYGPPLPSPWFGGAPAVMCADTPVARAGDACDLAADPCLPTRATRNPDGTVAGQDYLACVAGTCAAAAPPSVPDYLASCDDPTLDLYGATDALGVIAEPMTKREACLLAWDPATQAITSGVTITCVGDWECPELSLCDDAVPVIVSTGGPVAVCKPGPRGTLTPAMLSPRPR